MLVSIYHITLKLLETRDLGAKTSRCCHRLRNIIMDAITLCYLICKLLVVYGVISPPDATSSDNATFCIIFHIW